MLRPGATAAPLRAAEETVEHAAALSEDAPEDVLQIGEMSEVSREVKTTGPKG